MSGPRRSGAGRKRAEASGKGAQPTSNIEPLHPTEDPPEVEAFTEWDLGPVVQAAIAGMGITKPTPIQALAIGPVLDGRHVIAKAETGTGKTLAFGAPMIAKIDPSRRTVLGLVLSPTRELAEQVHKVMQELGAEANIKSALIVGGEPLGPQVKALQEGAQVVVGTPGRVMDLMGQGFLTFPWTEFVVLDEADKMLEIGFLEDIEKILAQVNEHRQTLMFSATFPRPLLKLARDQTENPVEIATAKGIATVDTIRQCCVEVDEDNRANLLQKIVRGSEPDSAFLVFCDRRTDVDRLMRRMERERYGVRALHGGYDQTARFRVMNAFRAQEVKVLIATDVASRGLDVKHISHVINYAAPRDHGDYTHRIGRTGRAGRTGTSITFVTPATRRYWRELLAITKFEVEVLKGPRDLFETKSQERSRNSPDDSPRRERSQRQRDKSDSARGRGSKEDAPKDQRPNREQPDSRQPNTNELASKPRERPDSGSDSGVADEAPRSTSKDKPRRKRKAAKSSDSKGSPNREAGGSGFGAGI